jgi:hypothetical protein
VAADDVQAAAVVMMAKRLGVKRLYVLNDLEGYGIAIAADVRAAARKLGVGIAGAESWDVVDRGYRDLAQRIEGPAPTGSFSAAFSPRAERGS